MRPTGTPKLAPLSRINRRGLPSFIFSATKPADRRLPGAARLRVPRVSKRIGLQNRVSWDIDKVIGSVQKNG